jgi:hypothetical protein
MAENTLGKGQGTTNPVPHSKIDVPIEGYVNIKFRFFPANSTATLEGTAQHEAKSLSGLPFVVGSVEGTSFKPLHDKLLRLGGGAKVTGKLDGGVFRAMNADDVKEWHQKLKDAKKKDVPPPTPLFHETPEYRVKCGATVGICIGVDAKAKFRKYPLWQVKADQHDIVVDVFETYGKAHGLQDKVGKVVNRTEEKHGKPHELDCFAARLTGDTWMRSTPKLGDPEVDALPDDQATAAMKAALKRIYKAEFIAVGANFAIDVPRQSNEQDSAKVRLLWLAHENANCVDNIVSLNLKQDVPSRIHPQAYAAAAKAAHEAGVDEIQFSSSWRPMLGSMPHRLSMGLDLVYLKAGKEVGHLNRSGLLPDPKSHKHASNDNLSKDELDAYDDWKAKEKTADAATAEMNRADKALKSAIAAKAKIKNPAPDTAEKLDKAVAEAKLKKEAADKAEEEARSARVEAEEVWGKEVQKHEPGPVGRYRRYVMQAKCVSQVLDPWYLVGLANHKPSELVPNKQEGESGLAFQHRNHMHLSIRDTELTA